MKLGKLKASPLEDELQCSLRNREQERMLAR